MSTIKIRLHDAISENVEEVIEVPESFLELDSFDIYSNTELTILGPILQSSHDPDKHLRTFQTEVANVLLRHPILEPDLGLVWNIVVRKRARKKEERAPSPVVLIVSASRVLHE